ncbi:PaaI family thioesterase [Hellea balneolensis]|uniref:PaaI family thioesterase n=1 Tax=Hellea balneolensis TaxID=287478 RepID=UPI0003FED3BB|nr:PaaI family thioesterase [Hellea balneolensis]
MVSHENIEKAIARIPYAQTLGVKHLFIGDELTLIMPYIESNIGNPMLPALHGGSISGLMEIAAIVQLMKEQDGGKLPKPIGINVDYLRKGNPKDTYARAIIFKQGSRVANVRVRAWQEDYEKPIAAMHGHYLMAKKG